MQLIAFALAFLAVVALAFIGLAVVDYVAQLLISHYNPEETRRHVQ